MAPSFVKIEPRKVAPELVKLLSNREQNVFVSSTSLNNDDLLLPGQSKQQTNLSTSPSVAIQSVPVQSLPLQTQQLVISPQQTSTTQICSLIPSRIGEPHNSVVTLPR